MAALLSLIVPGAGQLYLGERRRALLFFVPAAALIQFIVPWVICAIAGAYAAYASGNRPNGDRSGF